MFQLSTLWPATRANVTVPATDALSLRDLTISIPESELAIADHLTDICREQNNTTAQGIFALGLEENLGLSGNGLYGYDTVALSYLGSGLPSLDHQVVAGVATQDFWMGQFGVNPAASNFSERNLILTSSSTVLGNADDIVLQVPSTTRSKAI